MKPSWKNAPEWANYLAMDNDFTWWWYEEEPVWSEKNGEWSNQTNSHDLIAIDDYDGSKTLEKRPCQKESFSLTEKMVIIEMTDYDENDDCEIMLGYSNGPWLTYHKGDLEPEPDPQVGDILEIMPPKICGYGS